MRYFLVFLLAISCLAGGAPQPQSESPQELTALCAIAEDPLAYHEQRITLQAVISVGFESVSLFDPTCQFSRGMATIEISDSVTGEIETFYRLVEEDGAVLVTAAGLVHGPIPLGTIDDPTLPQRIREILERQPMRYGHLGSYEVMFEITDLLSVSRFEP